MTGWMSWIMRIPCRCVRVCVRSRRLVRIQIRDNTHTITQRLRFAGWQWRWPSRMGGDLNGEAPSDVASPWASTAESLHFTTNSITNTHRENTLFQHTQWTRARRQSRSICLLGGFWWMGRALATISSWEAIWDTHRHKHGCTWRSKGWRMWGGRAHRDERNVKHRKKLTKVSHSVKRALLLSHFDSRASNWLSKVCWWEEARRREWLKSGFLVCVGNCCGGTEPNGAKAERRLKVCSMMFACLPLERADCGLLK